MRQNCTVPMFHFETRSLRSQQSAGTVLDSGHLKQNDHIAAVPGGQSTVPDDGSYIVENLEPSTAQNPKTLGPENGGQMHCRYGHTFAAWTTEPITYHAENGLPAITIQRCVRRCYAVGCEAEEIA